MQYIYVPIIAFSKKIVLAYIYTHVHVYIHPAESELQFASRGNYKVKLSDRAVHCPQDNNACVYALYDLLQGSRSLSLVLELVSNQGGS